VSMPNLGTGGGVTNENFFLNSSGTSADGSTYNNAGPENVFIGNKSGAGFTGNSGYNLAVGVGACGMGGGTQVTGNSNVCLGTDTGRNLGNAASLTSDLIDYDCDGY